MPALFVRCKSILPLSEISAVITEKNSSRFGFLSLFRPNSILSKPTTAPPNQSIVPSPIKGEG